jgi:hypothetical protein
LSAEENANVMLASLLTIVEDELPALIADPNTPWQTLDVLYEEPRVERVWLQFGNKRIHLHRIHPCQKPYRHVHPWPSAILVLSGTYEMEVGKLPGNQVPAATLILSAGSSYEMLNPLAWHSVRPLIEPSLSVMLTGQPWGVPEPVQPKPDTSANRPLSEVAKGRLLGEFGLLLEERKLSARK